MWITLFFSFIIFCMLSGSEYIFNDIMDKERDKIHPIKRNRPIASGNYMYYMLLFLRHLWFFFGISGSIPNKRPIFFVVSLAYFLLIVFYSLFLKHIAIVDVLTISMGFVIRAIAGCFAIKVFVSSWLIICTFLVALFLALGKRRHELMLLENGAISHRKVLNDFSIDLLEKMMTIVTSALIMSYSLYTFLSNNTWMMLTIPIIIYGIFRYIFLVHSKNAGGEPEILFKDIGMLTCIILWVISTVGIIYVKKMRLRPGKFRPRKYMAKFDFMFI